MSSEPGLRLDLSFDAGHSRAPYPSHTEWRLVVSIQSLCPASA